MRNSRKLGLRLMCVVVGMLLLAPAVAAANDDSSSSIGDLVARLARMLVGEAAGERQTPAAISSVGQAASVAEAQPPGPSDPFFNCSSEPIHPACHAYVCKFGENHGQFCTSDAFCPGGTCEIPPGLQGLIQ